MNLSGHAIAGLRRLKHTEFPSERCESCAAALVSVHKHMVDSSSRKLLCACDACALILGSGAESRFRSVPSLVRSTPEFHMTDEMWEQMTIPVAFAFFYIAADDVVSVYPSPAGPVSSGVDSESWAAVVSQNQILLTLQPFVEALVVNRVNGARDYLIAPIDECYALVGIVRREWRGFSGFEAMDKLRHRLHELQERTA